MHYLEFLGELHELVQPRRYLEIGVRHGRSLALSRCPSVGIDPAFEVTAEIACDVRLFRTTSDEYFTRPDPLLGGDPFGLSFIDGMHLFEYALRDFINVERHSAPGSVVVFDDVLPRNVAEAGRTRTTASWTGDVFSIIPVLAQYRPGLSTVLVDTSPTGLMLIMGLDPEDRTLARRYDEIVRTHRRPDPQDVPDEVLDRVAVQVPGRVLASGVWEMLREQGSDPGDPGALQRQLAVELGPAYGPAAVSGA